MRKQKKSAGTASVAGFTRGLQKIKIDTGIYLLDTPGVIPYKEKDEIIFVQVKTNKQDILDGVYEFEKYPFPECVKKWVVLFEPRIKEPIVKNA